MSGAMRVAVSWLVTAAVVAVSACGGGGAKPDGGGGRDGGGFDIPVARGGAGGGTTDGGPADLPRSTGDFPYSGRWWAILTEPVADGGVATSLPFVIHWSDTDPADRLLWTLVEVLPMTIAAGADGSTIVRHAAGGTSGCWAIYPTSDPDALDVRACTTTQSSAAPLFGTFRRGARLVTQIPKAPLPAPDGYVPQVRVAGTDIGAGGDRVVFSVGPRLWYWKRDAGQVFDLGPGGAPGARLSPDGRRAMYGRANMPGAQVPMLLVFDSANGETTDLTTLVPIKPTAQYGSGGVFSPDGSKAAIRTNIPISGTGDLIVYDFGTKRTTMVAPGVNQSANGYQTDVFLASGDHLIYVGYDSALATAAGDATLNGYELSTGKYVSFGEAWNLVEFPGKKFAGLENATDGLVLIDDATFTPRVIATLVSGRDYLGGGGLVPSPDGSEVAYVDPQGVLNVRNVASGTTTAIANGVGCFEVPDPLSFPGSGQTRVVAALFAADGALVYNVAPSCGASGFYGIGRYDRTTRTEKVYTTINNGTRTLAMSPFGGIVVDPQVLPTVLAWPGPPVTLDPVVPLQAFSQDATFVFSAADRYLTFTSNGFVLVRDNQAGTVTKVTTIGERTFTSPVTGVTVSYGYGASLNTYLPDGTSSPVGSRATGIAPTPGTTKIAYTADGGLYVLALEPGAKPKLIGNGYPVVVTDTQVLFQDLDGICAAPL